jgi:hypothetical protein
MNYTKYFIIILTLITINISASDARYYELKAKYKNESISTQEEQELAPMAAQRKIKKYISDPNGDPNMIALHLNTVLAHSLYKNLYMVKVGNKVYQKCFFTAVSTHLQGSENRHPTNVNSSITRWTPA